MRNTANMLGDTANAMSIVRAVAGGAKEVDVQAELSKAGLETVPYELRAGAALWNLVQVERTGASKAGRTNFTHVKLTCNECLPLWLPPARDLASHTDSYPGEMEKE